MQIYFKEELANKVSSKVMNGLKLAFHPESDFYNLDLKSKEELIGKDYVGEEFFFASHGATIDKMLALYMTKPKRMLHNWETKLEERDLFIASKMYDDNTYEMLDKLMKETSKMWDNYFSIQKQVDKEDVRTSGDIEESASDKGLI